jgi:hypothetical protein
MGRPRPSGSQPGGWHASSEPMRSPESTSNPISIGKWRKSKPEKSCKKLFRGLSGLRLELIASSCPVRQTQGLQGNRGLSLVVL